MKRYIALILLLTAFVAPVAAQEDASRPKLTHEILEESRRESEAARVIDRPMGTDSISRDVCDRQYTIYSPWAFGGPASWSLHEGLNVSAGFSVTAGLGKHRPKGAGFGEHLAATYATSFGKDKRWIGAIGIYANRFDWGSYHGTEAGIAGIVGYHVNDWCNLYAYGTYNFVPMTSGGPNPYALRYGCYPYSYGTDCVFDPYARLRGRIGAAAEFKIGSNAAISVAFEHDFFDNRTILPVVPPPAPDNNKHPFGVNDAPNSAGGGGNWRR